ncbi:MAG TPA: glucose 1-dehydrogenase [Magnetospirillaceae bacterium]|jgi:2-deoxy-D-gluconate 3-dehydrogenase
MFDLKGHVALVTGGNGGIGLGMAKGMAQAGANIAVAGRNAKKAEAAIKELQAIGVKAEFVEANVLKEKACIDMVAETVKRFGRLDILVNNAGTTFRRRPEDITEAEWHEVVDTNLTAVFNTTKAAYPEMKKQGRGKMINIGSMMSIFAAPWVAPYAASKGGVVQLSRVFATAYAADNIQVNCILPGWIDTDLTAAARTQVPGLNEKVVARTPAGRWGRPDDAAGIAVFLASPASDFVTGTAIPLDGGFSIQVM